MWLCEKAQVGLGVAVACMLAAAPCMAAEGGGMDRATWDLAMRIINFGILVFVIYKYGKDPLIKFLVSKRASVELSLEELEKEKQDLTRRQEEQNALFAAIDDKIASIKDYYRRLGEDEKRKIMERAKIHSDQMLEDARLRADRELEKARDVFRAEVVDMALQLAEQRIRQNITVADDRMLVEDYIRQLGALTGQSSQNGTAH